MIRTDDTPPTNTAVPDIALIAAAIIGASLCVPCLHRKTGIPGPHIAAMLVGIRRDIAVRSHRSRCSGCLSTTWVYRLT